MNHATSRAPIGAIAAAALACLQPGIDPVFLTLLSDAGGLEPDAHGWVVGATQGGMAAGALLVWRFGARLPAHIAARAALAATALALLTAILDASLSALLLTRALFGTATGIVYTDAMSGAAARRPTTAYAAVFLTQLLLSALVALALPPVAHAAGPRVALALLAAAPATAALIAAQWIPRVRNRDPGVADAPPPSAAAWALALATVAFIAATMMIWSSAAALAIASGIAPDTIGVAVSAGSVIGAATALAVLRDRRVVPLPLTGVLASGGLLAPLVLTPPGHGGPFVAGILLLNIGSTAIIIRCSGAASAAGDGALFRRFVACTHPLGMIAGPLLGAALVGIAGSAGLVAGAVGSLALGCAALVVAARQAAMFSQVQKNSSPPLDENWTHVQTLP
ncbi:MFS transporter [uncultured Sphingomonas sp.]|uniref:MFS transporter n=1 Tax=uncultured Sphingomonas sp. TaxID=158754 RepID=UPI00258559D1|nr:MFS transporter [uncultured Sphingomonas sp.]